MSYANIIIALHALLPVNGQKAPLCKGSCFFAIQPFRLASQSTSPYTGEAFFSKASAKLVRIYCSSSRLFPLVELGVISTPQRHQFKNRRANARRFYTLFYLHFFDFLLIRSYVCCPIYVINYISRLRASRLFHVLGVCVVHCNIIAISL